MRGMFSSSPYLRLHCAAFVMLLLTMGISPASAATARCEESAAAAVTRINATFEQAHRSGEVTVMQQLLAADFELVHSGAIAAQVETRDAFLKRLSLMPKGLFVSRELDKPNIRVFGDIATASGYLTTQQKSRWTGYRTKANRFHYYRVFRRESCRWSMVAWHSGWAVEDRKEADFITDYLARFPAAAPAAGAATADGEQIYREACAFCHDSGAMGAPLRSDRAYWITAGADRARLYERSINGYSGTRGVMPAKGGRIDLSDEAVRSAVDRLLIDATGSAAPQ